MTLRIRLLSNEEYQQRKDPKEELKELRQTQQELLSIIENADTLAESLRMPSAISVITGAGLLACAAVYRSAPPLLFALMMLAGTALILVGIVMASPTIPLRVLSRFVDKRIARYEKKLGL